MKYVIVDIDGTLSIVGDRIKCISDGNHDWDQFYSRVGEDRPNYPIVDLCRELAGIGQGIRPIQYSLQFITGRSEVCRDATFYWLQQFGFTNDLYSHIWMRKEKDHRPDTKVKPELLKEFMDVSGAGPQDIAFILEDRSSVVKKWRELGYTCLQVAEGDF